MERPKIKLKTPLIGRLFDGVALMILAASAINIFMQWSSLPAQVPSHYNALGEPDAWSSKEFIFCSAHNRHNTLGGNAYFGEISAHT